MKLEEINNRNKDAVSYLVEALESGQSEVLTQYLSAMGRFHNYSFGNIKETSRLGVTSNAVASSHGDISNVASWGHYLSRSTLHDKEKD